ncbi:DUF1249 domain-containing protein [Thaumasiovibrio subtropicus]|uniref:DUF1249 domain-containing protein n=1 Tax=Thaumasiovibrio subtropicus TaxID=1891207 RepID=UPI000B35E5BB|nr:DUF1249 domain-containing protein [Thaumasiovibrio subtropicus]
MRTYETNYAKLVSLLPRGEQERCCYEVCGEDYMLTILEQTRYTTLIEIEQLSPLANQPATKLTVRLYHDARVAEVCATQQTTRLKPRYDYPNKGMHQKDEKHQVNQFLNDWLVHCLRHGTNKSSMCKLN